MRIDENDSSLNDTLIGDAVLTLLKSGKPVTVSELMEQLKKMADDSESALVKRACERTISALNTSINTSANSMNYSVRDAGNVLQHFSIEGQSNGKKNH